MKGFDSMNDARLDEIYDELYNEYIAELEYELMCNDYMLQQEMMY